MTQVSHWWEHQGSNAEMVSGHHISLFAQLLEAVILQSCLKLRMAEPIRTKLGSSGDPFTNTVAIEDTPDLVIVLFTVLEKVGT